MFRSRKAHVHWPTVAANVFGFSALLIFTGLFSLAVLMGRQMAAINCLVACTMLLYVLPVRRT